MPDIMAGTTGSADVEIFTPCVLCRMPNTFDFWETQGIDPQGWNASYADETVTVPLTAAAGDYTVTVRTDFTQNCNGDPTMPTSTCKHLTFMVVAAAAPVNAPGPGPQPCLSR